MIDSYGQGKLNRDGFLLASSLFYQQSRFEEAYESALKAQQKDPIYPQTYQQLIKVCEKLEKQEELRQYQAYLAKISW